MAVSGHSPVGDLFASQHSKEYSWVQSAISKRQLNWCFTLDTRESNIDTLIANDVQLLVFAPGLRFMFYRKNFDKRRRVFLTTMEYLNNDVRPVMRKLRELDEV